MPTKGKGKRKVTAGPMDPRKTREPVTGHPDTDLKAAPDSTPQSPHPDTDYESDTVSVVTALPPTPTPTPKQESVTAPTPTTTQHPD